MKNGKGFIVLTLMIVVGGCLERNTYRTEDNSDRVGRYLLDRPPQRIQKSLDAVFGNKIVLLGYDLDRQEVARGESFRVTWYWRCLEAPGPRWRLFTHVFGDKGKTRLNRDKVGPIRRNYQAEHWRAGVVIRDVQDIEVPKNWSSDIMELRVGLWRGSRRMNAQGRSRDMNNRGRGPIVAVRPSGPLVVQVPYTDHAPVIDGEFEDEAVWSDAAKLGYFKHTMLGKRAGSATDVRLLWDDEHLFVAMRAEDSYLVSRYRNHDDELWHEDVFEIFLDPKADLKNYYELQVNPAGVVFDSFLPEYRKNQNDWTRNAVVATQMQGDLGDDEEDDKAWIAELAIPFSAMQAEEMVPPKAGDTWRANFFRIDKMKNKKDFGAWSPPLRGDFHALDRFGMMTFVQPDTEKRASSAETATAAETPKPEDSSQKNAQQTQKSK